MEYLILGLLFVLSSFFSGSETALTSVNKYRLESKAENGDKKAIRVLDLVKYPDKMLTAILIGNNFVNILLTAIATSLVIEKFGEGNVIYSTILLTIFLLIVSEITPKSIAAIYPEKTSYFVIGPISLILTLLQPIIFLITKFTFFVSGVLSKKIKKEDAVSSDDIKVLVNKGSEEGVFHTDETILLTSVLDFKKKGVGDALKTHRTDIISISLESDYEEVRNIIKEQQYSRYPVYEDDTENIIGFFYAKDFVSWSVQPEESISKYIDKDVLFIPETMGIGDLFKEMQEKRKHVAMVIDEYGGIRGLISLEDVIEEMIGYDINDEKDEHDVWIEEIDEQTIMCMAEVKLEKVEAATKIKFENNTDTLREFVLEYLKKLPTVGDSFVYQGCTFTIREMKKNRLVKTEIKLEPKGAELT